MCIAIITFLDMQIMHKTRSHESAMVICSVLRFGAAMLLLRFVFMVMEQKPVTHQVTVDGFNPWLDGSHDSKCYFDLYHLKVK